jgi:hypothetical protein
MYSRWAPQPDARSSGETSAGCASAVGWQVWNAVRPFPVRASAAYTKAQSTAAADFAGPRHERRGMRERQHPGNRADRIRRHARLQRPELAGPVRAQFHRRRTGRQPTGAQPGIGERLARGGAGQRGNTRRCRSGDDADVPVRPLPRRQRRRPRHLRPALSQQRGRRLRTTDRGRVRCRCAGRRTGRYDHRRGHHHHRHTDSGEPGASAGRVRRARFSRGTGHRSRR